jgi:hypothetical protein
MLKRGHPTIQSVEEIHADIKEAKKRDVLRFGAR